jgi:iron complex outermembrane receptor protein
LPQTAHQQLAFGQATGSWKPTDTLSLQGVGYDRQLWQQHIDGNSTDAQSCIAAAQVGQLCIGDGATPLNQNMSTFDTFPAGTALGEIDRNWTASGSYVGPCRRPAPAACSTTTTTLWSA